MGVEQIKDKQGKEHMTVKLEEFYDDEFMGDDLEDFEILQSLGKSEIGAVYKVISKINQKIYAMKKLDISKIKGNNASELCQKEIDTLKKLNHSLVIKYYKSFYQNGCFFFISEYMDNGDLNGVVQAYQNLKKPIEEDKLWNIFIQCMTGLVYIHSKGITHNDIKLENIFINNDGDVKIGDLGLAEKIMPHLGNDDGKTEDIRAMGEVFMKLLYIFGVYNNQNNYSNELYDIVNKMKQANINKLNANNVLDMFKEGFSRKYEQNSSISCILSCLFSIQKFSNYFTGPNQVKYLTDNLQTKPISYTVSTAFRILFGNINCPWFKTVSLVREVLSKENKSYGGKEELEPRRILFFMLEKMHQELKNSDSKDNLKKAYSSDENFAQDKMKTFNNFYEIFQKKNKSPISDYFFGIMKTKKQCCICHKNTYSFNLFSYVSFNLDLLTFNNQNSINIIDCFHIQNQTLLQLDKNKLIYCKYCKTYQNHGELKQFFSMPYFLIICFDRGTDCHNKINININDTLNIGNEADGQTSLRNFQLNGIIKRVNRNNKEHYISLYFDHTKNCWVMRDDENIQPINSPSVHTEGFIIMMFYINIDNMNGNNFVNNLNQSDMNLSHKMMKDING